MKTTASNKCIYSLSSLSGQPNEPSSKLMILLLMTRNAKKLMPTTTTLPAKAADYSHFVHIPPLLVAQLSLKVWLIPICQLGRDNQSSEIRAASRRLLQLCLTDGSQSQVGLWTCLILIFPDFKREFKIHISPGHWTIAIYHIVRALLEPACVSNEGGGCSNWIFIQ